MDMVRLLENENPAAEARGYLRGGFGDEMDYACLSVTEHFRTLPGWQARQVNALEIVYLTGFFAFVALASSPTARLAPAEAATGARASVARILMLQGTKPAQLTSQIRAFQKRLNQYSTMWIGVIKEERSFGSFAALVFENVQVGERTRQGYLEHLNAFPEFCDRRIKALHAAVPARTPATK